MRKKNGKHCKKLAFTKSKRTRITFIHFKFIYCLFWSIFFFSSLELSVEVEVLFRGFFNKRSVSSEQAYDKQHTGLNQTKQFSLLQACVTNRFTIRWNIFWVPYSFAHSNGPFVVENSLRCDNISSSHHPQKWTPTVKGTKEKKNNKIMNKMNWNREFRTNCCRFFKMFWL